MIGTFFNLASVRICAATSPPSKCGIITSSRIKSGLNWRAVSSARTGLFSSRMSYSVRVSFISLVKPSSSSTIRIFVLRFFIFALTGQRDRRDHATFVPVADMDASPMQVDDGFRYGQTKPGSLAGRLGRKIGVKDFRKLLLRNADSGIGYLHHDDEVACSAARLRAFVRHPPRS